MRRRPSSPAALVRSLAFPACLLALVACGGKIAAEPSGSTEDAGATNDPPGTTTDDSGVTTTPTDPSNPGGPIGDPFPVCPALAPTAGATCTTPNLGCAYVDYDKGSCISLTCDSKGVWETSTPAGC